MVDFQNGIFVKLKPADNGTFSKDLSALLLSGENILYTFKAVRDGLVFTDKRIITMNFQGMTGKKVDYSSLPYSKIQAFSVETIGFSMDAEMELWFSGLGKVKFEFNGNANMIELCRLIGEKVL